MTSRVAGMTALERAARDRWLYGSVAERIEPASHVRYGRCEECGRVEDEDGKMLVVARRPRGRFECLRCFEFGPPEEL